MDCSGPGRCHCSRMPADHELPVTAGARDYPALGRYRYWRGADSRAPPVLAAGSYSALGRCRYSQGWRTSCRWSLGGWSWRGIGPRSVRGWSFESRRIVLRRFVNRRWLRPLRGRSLGGRRWRGMDRRPHQLYSTGRQRPIFELFCGQARTKATRAGFVGCCFSCYDPGESKLQQPNPPGR